MKKMSHIDYTILLISYLKNLASNQQYVWLTIQFLHLVLFIKLLIFRRGLILHSESDLLARSKLVFKKIYMYVVLF